jgi:TRAP-type C4-dicarboxylate transport system permease small subunit
VDYRIYTEFTGILEIPIWWAFVPELISLLLLLMAAVITLIEAIAAIRPSRST